MSDQVTIRMARHADAPALHALEELDSHELGTGDVVVAEVDGEVRAALPVSGGPAVADPFHPSDVLVELLAVHAAQLRRDRRRPTPTRRALALAAR
jgi:hypothetical protein